MPGDISHRDDSGGPAHAVLQQFALGFPETILLRVQPHEDERLPAAGDQGGERLVQLARDADPDFLAAPRILAQPGGKLARFRQGKRLRIDSLDLQGRSVGNGAAAAGRNR